MPVNYIKCPIVQYHAHLRIWCPVNSKRNIFGPVARSIDIVILDYVSIKLSSSMSMAHTHTHTYIQFKSTVTLCNVSLHIWYKIVWGIITFMGFCNVFPGTNHFMGEKGGFPWNTHQFCRLRVHWNIPVWRLQGLSAHVEFHTLNGPR